MKIIKSKLFMRKEALWSNQDSGLPMGVTEKEISEVGAGPEEDVVSSQQGESEIEVNWQEFNNWYSTGGISLPGNLANRTTPSMIKLVYYYSYDYNGGIDGRGEAQNIQAIQLDDYDVGQTLVDERLLQAFVTFYEEKITEDIEISEQEAKRAKSSDFELPLP